MAGFCNFLKQTGYAPLAEEGGLPQGEGFEALGELRDRLRGLPVRWRDEHRFSAAAAELEGRFAFYHALGALARAWDAGDEQVSVAQLRLLCAHSEALDDLPETVVAFLVQWVFPHLKEKDSELASLFERLGAAVDAEGPVSSQAVEQHLAEGDCDAAIDYLLALQMDGELPSWALDALLQVAKRAEAVGAFEPEERALDEWLFRFDRWKGEPERVARAVAALVDYYGERAPETLAWYCRYGDLLLRSFGTQGGRYLEFVAGLYCEIRKRSEASLTPMAHAFLNAEVKELTPYWVRLKDIPRSFPQEEGNGVLSQLFTEALWQPVWLDLEPRGSSCLECSYEVDEGWDLELVAGKLGDLDPGIQAGVVHFRFADGRESDSRVLCEPMATALKGHAVAFHFSRYRGRVQIYCNALWRIDFAQQEGSLSALLMEHDPVDVFPGLTLFRDEMHRQVDEVLRSWGSGSRFFEWGDDQDAIIRERRYKGELEEVPPDAWEDDEV